MGMEFYGDSYKGNDEPIFVGIPTFLKLPWLRSKAELEKVRPDVADRKSTRLNSSHIQKSRMPSSA